MSLLPKMQRKIPKSKLHRWRTENSRLELICSKGDLNLNHKQHNDVELSLDIRAQVLQ